MLGNVSFLMRQIKKENVSILTNKGSTVVLWSQGFRGREIGKGEILVWQVDWEKENFKNIFQ